MPHIYAIDRLLTNHDVPPTLLPVVNKLHELHKRYGRHSTLYMFGLFEDLRFWCFINPDVQPCVKLQRVVTGIRYTLNYSLSFMYAIKALPEMKSAHWQWFDCDKKAGEYSYDDLTDGKWIDLDG